MSLISVDANIVIAIVVLIVMTGQCGCLHRYSYSSLSLSFYHSSEWTLI